MQSNNPEAQQETRKLDNLLSEIKGCHICEKDLPLGPNPVLRVSSEAKILVAGQAPGTRVHETSIPFNDPSGDRLREWMGIDKSDFYDTRKVAIVPMGFCYPGKGRSGDLPPRKECKSHWHDRLFKLMPNIQLVLAIGQYAQNYHLKSHGYKNLTDTVKHWQEFLPRAIPLPHPSPRNNLWLAKNSWFEAEVLPTLKARVKALLK